MKKFLSLLMVAIMVMAMSITAFADSTIIHNPGAEGVTGGDANGTLDFGGATEGTLVVTATNLTGEAGNGWGIGGICFGGWSVDAAYEIVLSETTAVATGETTTFTFDLAAVLAAANGADVNINLYNGYSVVNVALETAGAEPAGDATPVAAMAIIALASCAAVVVLRKKEA